MRYIIIILIALITLGGCSSSLPATQTNSLNSDEQAALNFITEHTPELDQSLNQQNKAVVHMGDFDFDGAMPHINNYVKHWNQVKKEWESFPAAKGKTAKLEHLFETAANDLREINLGLLNLVDGVSGDRAVAGIKAYTGDKIKLDDELATFEQSK